jgi:hypothetical protein
MLFAVRPRQLTLLLVTLLGAIGLLAVPAFAGPPFRTDDPEPVEFQHCEINLFSQGTQTNDGWSGFLPGFEVTTGRFRIYRCMPLFSRASPHRVVVAPASRWAILSLA